MTLNHNFGCFSGVGSGIAGNYEIGEVQEFNNKKLNRYEYY